MGTANTAIGVRRAAAHSVKEAQSACLMQVVPRARLGSGFRLRHGSGSFIMVAEALVEGHTMHKAVYASAGRKQTMKSRELFGHEGNESHQLKGPVGRDTCAAKVQARLCMRWGGLVREHSGPGRVPRFLGANRHRQYTVPLCVGCEGPRHRGIA